jgi:hypothetical protein
MKDLGMARLDYQNLPVERFSFRQPSGLVVLEREIESLLDRHHASGG